MASSEDLVVRSIIVILWSYIVSLIFCFLIFKIFNYASISLYLRCSSLRWATSQTAIAFLLSTVTKSLKTWTLVITAFLLLGWTLPPTSYAASSSFAGVEVSKCPPSHLFGNFLMILPQVEYKLFSLWLFLEYLIPMLWIKSLTLMFQRCFMSTFQNAHLITPTFVQTFHLLFGPKCGYYSVQSAGVLEMH